MHSTIQDFQSFAMSIGLSLEFTSPNKNEGYLQLFSYDGEDEREYLMYLYGENQFDTAWEYEYHDCLTIGRQLLSTHDKVLILGSGDLMNHRFLGVYDVDLIDIDPFMTNLAQSHPFMLELNKYTPSQNYQVHNRDAIPFIEEQGSELHKYRYIIIDFPVMISPFADEVKKFGLERFFSKEMFVGIILGNLSSNGLMTMQADDTFVHTEHKRYFEDLLKGTEIYFHIYTIDFRDSELKQYFYMFTKNPSIYEYFQKHIQRVPASKGVFRQDEYFTNLFELMEQKKISYQEYIKILTNT